MTQIEFLQQHGYRRARSARGSFRFPGAPPGARTRLHALRLPPAWTDVAVSANPRAKLQAVGRDKKGRWQYVYSQQAVREREQRKFDTLLSFGRALPRLRRAIDRGMRLRGLPKEKVMACILRILSTCFMRPGSHIYAKENGSFGIATLRRRHASVRGDTVRFEYRGKAGKLQVRELRDRRVARIVRELKKLTGQGDLFQWVQEDGTTADVRRRHINACIKETMGQSFSAKDFRTWAGSLVAACVLARMHHEAVDRRTDRRKMVVAAVKETAAQLGNTPAVCRASYIWPSVLRDFERGKVLQTYYRTIDELVEARNHTAERALLELLRAGRSALTAPPRKVPPRPTRLTRRMRRGTRARRLAQAFAIR